MKGSLDVSLLRKANALLSVRIVRGLDGVCKGRRLDVVALVNTGEATGDFVEHLKTCWGCRTVIKREYTYRVKGFEEAVALLHQWIDAEKPESGSPSADGKG